MIELYSDSSPNGFKATIALEETGLDYTLHHIQIEQGEHRSADFLKLNPHGRIPVITDSTTGIVLFESAAILLYIVEKSGQLLPKSFAERWQALQWLQFHSSSMGPILGQRVHFEIFAETKLQPAITRYQKLTNDIYQVLNQRLSNAEYFAGSEYSIADIAAFGWTHIAQICGFNFDHHPYLSNWHQKIAARPAVLRGITLPQPATGP
ncbi:glutathione S-transferase family protein [Pseudochrobactrum saccharolyticum]|uniref:glutathione S-transferase family protein n=1 Tax=Pseudochrobactrum saccharolyticum TaxID=354352 RepID=UPI002767E48D|nr:glutathione binding-like protein [Pseudochrobactrum saccharolyticum]MDP8251180.1 glutathione S-transferase N-terminal domain-containing protein [Pseudochrobactrum saccharolyticum]